MSAAAGRKPLATTQKSGSSFLGGFAVRLVVAIENVAKVPASAKDADGFTYPQPSHLGSLESAHYSNHLSTQPNQQSNLRAACLTRHQSLGWFHRTQGTGDSNRYLVRTVATSFRKLDSIVWRVPAPVHPASIGLRSRPATTPSSSFLIFSIPFDHSSIPDLEVRQSVSPSTK